MYDRAVEIDEAIAAGHRALDALAEAADSLDSAKRWGIVDILGGGFVTSMVKHSRLGDANRELARAREEIRAFTREISDVRDLHLLNAGRTGGDAGSLGALLAFWVRYSRRAAGPLAVCAGERAASFFIWLLWRGTRTQNVAICAAGGCTIQSLYANPCKHVFHLLVVHAYHGSCSERRPSDAHFSLFGGTS